MKNMKSTVLKFTYVMNHVEKHVEKHFEKHFEKHVECYECYEIHNTFSKMFTYN